MALVEDLYKKLSEGGYYTKTLGEFETQLGDPEYRKKVHGVVTRDGIEDTDFETFDIKYTPLKKKEDSESPLMEVETSGSLATPEMGMQEPLASSSSESNPVIPNPTPDAPEIDVMEYTDIPLSRPVDITTTDKSEGLFKRKKKKEEKEQKSFLTKEEKKGGELLLKDNLDTYNKWLEQRNQETLAQETGDLSVKTDYSVLNEGTPRKELQNVTVTAPQEKKRKFKDKLEEFYYTYMFPMGKTGGMREYFRLLKENQNNPDYKNFLEYAVNEESIYNDARNAINFEVFRSGEATAANLLNSTLARYGYDVQQSRVGEDYVRITSPGKQTIQLPTNVVGGAPEARKLLEFVYDTWRDEKEIRYIADKNINNLYEDGQKGFDKYADDVIDFALTDINKFKNLVEEDVFQGAIERRSKDLSIEMSSLEASIDTFNTKYQEFNNAFSTRNNLVTTYNDLLNKYKKSGKKDLEAEAALKSYYQSIQDVEKAYDFESIKKELETKQAYLKDRSSVLQEEYKNIDQMSAALAKSLPLQQAEKEKQGNFLGYVFNSFAQGYANVAEGATALAADVTLGIGAAVFGMENLMPEGEYQKQKDKGLTGFEIYDQSLKKFKKQVIKDFNKVGEMYFDTTEEYMQSEDRTTFEKVLGSVLTSVATATAGPKGIGFYVSSYADIEEQMSGEEFKDMPEIEKMLYKIPYSLAIGALEKFGYNVLSGSNKSLTNKFVNDLLGRIITKLPKGASLELIKHEINKDLSRMLVTGGLDVVLSAGAEGIVEGSQALTETGIKNVVNAIYDKELFQDVPDLTTYDGVVEALGQAGEETYLGTLGGLMFATVTNSYNIIKERKFNKQSNELFDQYEKLLKDGTTLKSVENLIKIEVDKGSITEAEALDVLKSVKACQEIIDIIPNNLSTEDKRKSFDYLLEKKGLEQDIAGKDEALIAGQKERIEQINNDLKIISKNAIEKSTEQQQEGAAEGGVVQREGVDQGQPQVGQTEGAVGETTQPETNISDSTIAGGGVQETEVVDVEAQKKIKEKIDELEFRLNQDYVDRLKGGNGILLDKARLKLLEELKTLKQQFKSQEQQAVSEQPIVEETITEQPTVEEINIVPGETAVVSDVEITYPTNEEAEVRIEERTKPEYVEATSENLQEENVEQLSQELEGEFGLLTAENPMKQPLTEEENTQLNQKAEEWLKSKGYNPRRVTGKYDQAENSFFVPGLKFDDAVEFANQFNQESVAHSEGLVYQDGTVNPRVKQKDNFSFEGYSPESNFVSVVRTPDGLKTFSVGYDFDTRTERTVPSQSSMGTVISGTDVEIDNQAKKISKPRMTKIVANAAKAVARILPNTKFIVHDTQDSFTAATGETNAGGYFNLKNNEIHINLEEANGKTVSHEVFHAVLLNLVKTDANAAATTKKMIEAVSKKIDSNPKLKQYLDDFASQYEENIQNEEKVSELVGVLAEQYESSPESIKDLIKRWLDRIAKAFGLNPFNRNEVYDVLNTIARKTAKGKTIKQKDVKKIESSTEISNANKRFQSNFSDFVSKLTFVFDKNGNKFKKLEDDGYITRNKSIKDFNGEYMFLHQPDAAFSGMIYKDGEILVEGKGGVFYPIKFHEDGYFWASTDETANKMAKDLNKVFEQNGGVIYMGLTTAPYDKLLSSTTMSNSVLDFFLSKAFDKNFSITPSQLKTMLNNAAKVTREKKTLIKKDGKPVLDKKGNKQYRIKLVGLGTQFKLNKSDSVDILASRIKELLNPDITSFEDRKTFVEELIKEAANVIRSNPKSVEQFGKLFSQGIQNKYFKGITKTGKLSISTANMTQALSEMFTEPMLKEGVKRDKGGQVYAVLELRGKVKDVNSDKHESYPKAIQSEKANNKVTLHILKDRFNWSEVFEDFETNDIVASKERENKIFPTSGVSVRGLRVNTSKIQDQGPAPRRQKKRREDLASFQIMEESKKYMDEKTKRTTAKDLNRKYLREFEDRQVDIKKALLGIGNKYSQRAYNVLVSKAGASGWANDRFKEADKKIFGGLRSKSIQDLNSIIYNLRIIAINENRAEREMKPYTGMDVKVIENGKEVVKPFSSDIAKSDLEDLKQLIGEKQFKKLEARAKEYFKVFNENLLISYESGRITKEVYESLRDIDYSPIRTIKYMIGESLKNTEQQDKMSRILGISIDDIKSLGDENKNAIINDARWLMMMGINASAFKSFENRLFNAIDDAYINATDKQKEVFNEFYLDNPVVGKKDDGSPIFKYDKEAMPEGFSKITFYKDGIKKKMVIEDRMASQLYDVRDIKQAAKDEFVKSAGKFTLANLLRFRATGGNPLFIIRNAPMDFLNVLFFSDVYGKMPLVGKYIGAPRLAFDFVKNFLKSTAGSKFSEIKKEFLKYGGGMDYMATDGIRMFNSRYRRIQKDFDIAREPLYLALKLSSFLGEKSEEAFRLSVYEKTKNDLIKKYKKDNDGKTPEGQDLEDILFESVREAREIVDFNQGGNLTKRYDAFLPYLNVGFQSFRRAKQFAIKSPVRFADSMIQATILGGSIMAASISSFIRGVCGDELTEEECNQKLLDALNSVPEYVRANNFVLFTGDKDEEGNWEYYKIAKLPILAVASTFGEQTIIRYFLGGRGVDYDPSGKIMKQTWQSAMPFDPEGLASKNPLIAASIAYGFNYDTFRKTEIFKKPKQFQNMQITAKYEGKNDDNVNNFFKYIADTYTFLGYEISPIRLQAAVEKFITSETTNPTTSLLYATANGLFVPGTDIGEAFSESIDAFKKNVGKKFVGYTSKSVLENQDKEATAEERELIGSDIYNKTTKMWEKIDNIYDSGETLSMGELYKMVVEDFGTIEAENYFNKFNNYISNRDVDKRLLNILYERNPRLQALYLYQRYGSSIEKNEIIELNKISARTRSKLSDKTIMIYNKEYFKK